MMEGGEGVMLGVHRMGGEMMEGKNNDRSGVRVMGEGARGGDEGGVNIMEGE